MTDNILKTTIVLSLGLKMLYPKWFTKKCAVWFSLSKPPLLCPSYLDRKALLLRSPSRSSHHNSGDFYIESTGFY